MSFNGTMFHYSESSHVAMNSPSPVKTVDRLVRILDCFSPEQPAWSLAELCAHLGLPKSTLHRFLVSLESHGVLRREAADRRWRLGYRLSIWGNAAAQSTGLRHVARPVMRDLVAATGETAILTVYQAHEVICIEKVETSHSVRLTLDVGMRRLPHAGASSKVLMACLPEEEIQAIIQNKGLPRLCSSTITDPDELRAELVRIRELGYAESREETDLGAWGVATPIHDQNGDTVAAIGIAGPSSRCTEERVEQYVALCRQAACQISALLGLHPHPSPLPARGRG
jgi:IclR family KDG regulon transcriptional repressor